jgi:hypothetical protein
MMQDLKVVKVTRVKGRNNRREALVPIIEYISIPPKIVDNRPETRFLEGM